MAQRQTQNDIGIKKAAAGSLLNGKLGGESNGDSTLSLRDQLENAWGGEV